MYSQTMGSYSNEEKDKQRCVLYATIASLLTILLTIGVITFVLFYLYEINPLGK